MTRPEHGGPADHFPKVDVPILRPPAHTFDPGRQQRRQLLRDLPRPRADLMATTIAGSPHAFVGIRHGGYVRLTADELAQLIEELGGLLETLRMGDAP